jgi:homoserine O-acetyltransferase
MNPFAQRDSATSFLRSAEPFPLDSGASLPSLTTAYRTWGRLSAAGDNAILVCHALTGSADVDRWWGGVLGPGKALDPDRDFVVAANTLGSCFGSSGPTERRPGGGIWGPEFPAITIRDQVRAQARLLEALGVRRLALVVGGSLGGLQALEWPLLYPGRVEAIASLSASGRHSPWCIGLSALQRRAIERDPKFRQGRYPADDPPAEGLALARGIAMATYRSPCSFGERFGRARRDDGRFAVESYLEHQGRKLVDRFDANSYLALTRAMDTHDVARGRGEYAEVLAGVDVPALVVASHHDVLYPRQEQLELAQLLPAADFEELASAHGHDAFLIDQATVGGLLAAFRRRVAARAPGALVAAGGAA